MSDPIDVAAVVGAIDSGALTCCGPRECDRDDGQGPMHWCRPCLILALLAALDQLQREHAQLRGCDGGCSCEVWNSRHEAAMALYRTVAERDKLTADLAAVEDRAERYAMEANDLTLRMIALEADLAAAQASLESWMTKCQQAVTAMDRLIDERDAAQAALAQAEQERDAQRQDAITTAIEQDWSGR